MTRRRSLGVTRRDHDVLPPLQALKVEHLFRGYRHIWTYLRGVEHRSIDP